MKHCVKYCSLHHISTLIIYCSVIYNGYNPVIEVAPFFCQYRVLKKLNERERNTYQTENK